MQPNVYKYYVVFLCVLSVVVVSWGDTEKKATLGKNIYVVAATLVSEEHVYLGEASYRVYESLRGNISTGEITILFYKDSVKNSLPDKALLILEDGTLGSYRVVGKDAERCIIADSPENRHLVIHVENLLETPVEKRISQGSAQAVIEEYLIENNLMKDYIRWSFARSNFGWLADVTFGSPEHPEAVPLHGDILFYVGDDGEIKNVR